MIAEKIKPAIKWPGGKTRMLKHLLPVIEARKHVCYCEPFAGGLAVLLGKARSQVEVINDLNGDLINFYRQVKYHPDALIAEFDFILNSRKEFKDRKTQSGLTEIQRAANWLYLNSISFGADGASYGVRQRSGGGANMSRENLLQSVRDLAPRLSKVSVENVSWEYCLELYDIETTLFYIDPPYTTGECKNYAPWKTQDMARLYKKLLKLKGQWILTVDDTPENRALFKKFILQEVSTAAFLRNRSKPGQRFGELICASEVRL